MDYTEKQYILKANKSYEIMHGCGGCGQKQNFVNTNCFRINANGNKLDAWLIYQCKKCRHTLNIPIFERVNISKIDDSLYERMTENDVNLAKEYGRDYGFFKSKKFEIDPVTVELGLFDEQGNCAEPNINKSDKITISNESGMKIKPYKMVSLVFKISRSSAKKMVDDGKLILAQNHNALTIEFADT